MSTAADPTTHDPRLSFRAVHALRGPNIWSNRPILEAWVDLGELTDTASNEVEGFNERLISWLPEMIEHRCSIGERGGFFERLRRGTYPGHILEHVCLELQSRVGPAVGYGKARGTSEERVYRVVVSYVDEPLGRAALVEARDLLLAAYDGRDFDVAAAVERLRKARSAAMAEPVALALITAAKARGVPVIRLNETGILQLGHGARQHRLHGGLTDRTGAIGEEIGGDRALHRPMLQSVGVPVPEWERVDSAEEAREAADEMTPPYVVKPLYRDTGPGISPPLDQPAQAEAAFAAAREESRYVAVERLTAGVSHRVLVVDGQAIAAARLDPAEREGGGTVDVTESLHAEIAAHAVAAARIAGLNPASVDLTVADPAQPLTEQGGAVTRLLPRADLSAHLEPRADAPRPVAEALIDGLFADEDAGRIPLVVVAGGPERLAVGRLIAWAAGHAGRRVGLAWPGGVEVERRVFPGRRYTAFEAARAVVMHPRVELGVLAVGRADVLREGLGFDRVAVGIITGYDEQAELLWPGWGFDEPETELPRAERCAIDAVRSEGLSVLRGDLPGVVDLAEHARGRVLLYADRADEPNLVEHRAEGGAVAYADAGRAVIRDPVGGNVVVPFDPARLPTAWVLPALVALHALGIDAEAVRGAWAGLDARELQV